MIAEGIQSRNINNNANMSGSEQIEKNSKGIFENSKNTSPSKLSLKVNPNDKKFVIPAISLDK